MLVCNKALLFIYTIADSILIFLKFNFCSKLKARSLSPTISDLEIITCLEVPVYIGEKPQLAKETNITIVRKNLFIIGDNIK